VVRQRSAKPSSAGSIPAVASIFPTPAGFHFEATVTSHGWYQLAPFRWDGKVLRRKERLGNRTVDLEITFRGGALHVSHPVPSERIARMFQLNVDVAEFVALARQSPDHAWVEEGGFGRLLCGASVWEDAVKIICTTNTTWRQTVRMAELLVAKCGRGGAFPSQEDVARFSEAELKEDCRLGYRAKSILALARTVIPSVSEGPGRAGGTTSAPPPGQVPRDARDDYRTYLQLPGIGPYGAAHLLAMDGQHDFIAVDTEFRRFVRERYHRGRRISDEAMLRRYAKWGRWKYLAYWSELRRHG
jgi:3-methyladenine DNA glycosylase/8-oxoguanine DNA glycosylase